jgi:hypothetical protein
MSSNITSTTQHAPGAAISPNGLGKALELTNQGKALPESPIGTSTAI